MFINPRIAIQEGWITGIADEETQVQPNAIDFTLDKVFVIEERNEFVISEAGKKMRGGAQLGTVPDRRSGLNFWHLMTRTSYDGMSNVFVRVPDGVAVMLIVRSTFNRNGIFLTSGLYDSGFEGNIGFVLHNMSGSAVIGEGTRIGQVIFAESQTANKLYAGGYNTTEGQHWSESDDGDS
jgi:deoxycytidine triphosphate deaminase